MTAVSSRVIKEVLQQLAPSQEDTKNFPICLIQCYSKEGNQIPFLFRFAIEDSTRSHNHSLITSSSVYCSIHNILMNGRSSSRHIRNLHQDNGSETELIAPPSFCKTYQFSLLLYWQIHHQISQNAIHSSILRHGIWEIPSSDVWDTYYNSVYDCTKAVINHEIEIAEHVSIFIDGWTKNHRFEGIRLSFLNYGTLINRFLSMMFLEGKPHTANNISTAIRKLDEEYHFLSKAKWFISDCASVNSQIANILNVEFVPCGAHRYMICFEDFNENQWLKEIISWLSSLSKSMILHDRISMNEENSFSSLLSPSNTRWMYRYQMIERGFKCKQDILDFGISNVSKEDLENRFTQMQEFLDIFSEYNLISILLQKENIPIHEVFLLFCKAMEHTNDLIGEYDSGKLQFFGPVNPFVRLYYQLHSRFLEDYPNWANLLIASFLLNGNLGDANWMPEEQYIIAAENKIKELIGENAYENEYIPFRTENPNGIIDPFSFWFNSPYTVLSGIAKQFLILIGTNCKLESDFSKAAFILSGRSSLSVENFDKRAILKLNDDIAASLLVLKTPELFSDLPPNEQIAYKTIMKYNILNSHQYLFPDPNEIKERYGELDELNYRNHLQLLTNLQRKLQYVELSEFVPLRNNPSLAIPTTNILPPHLSPSFTKGKYQ